MTADIMSKEFPSKVKISKFILIPIASILDGNGEVIRERQLKPAQIFTAKGIDLRKFAERLEKSFNNGISELEKTTGD